MKLNTSSSTLTRPSATDAYAANDVIASSTTANDVVAMQFKDLANTFAGTGYITKAKLWVDGAAFAADIRLHLFTSEPTKIADNEPFQLDFSLSDTHIGYIDFTTPLTGGTGSDAVLYELDDLRMAIKSLDDNGGNPIYGVLVTDEIFTPTANQRFKVELTCDAYEY